MKKTLLNVLLFTSACACAQPKQVSPTKVGLDVKVTSRIDVYYDSMVKANKIGGAVVLLARDGKVFHHKSYGWTDKVAGIPAAKNSIFNIASMTKAFITTSILMLEEDGLLRLEDPVSKYIPEVANMKVGVEYFDSATQKKQLRLENLARPITIRHLLSHMSGFQSSWLHPGLVADLYKEAGEGKYANLREMVLAYIKLPLGCQPGTEWRYDFSTNVLAYLVEVIAKQPIQNFVGARIIKPLKMNDTGWQVEPVNLSRVVKSYNVKDGTITQSDWEQLKNPVTIFRGNVGLWSTAEDYFKLCQVLVNDGKVDGVRILRPETVKKLYNNVEIGKDGKLFSWLPGYGFGLGFAVRVDNNKANFGGSEGELCWFGATNTAYWIDRKEKIVAVVLTHFPASNFYQFSKDVRSIVYSSIGK